MNIDWGSWGPMTVLAVVGALIVLCGGAAEVALTPYTFGQYLDDLKPIVAILTGGVALGRGIRLQPHVPTTRLKTARRRKTPHN